MIINRIRPDLVARGDMMSLSDIQEILTVPIIGAVTDEEEIVISSNNGGGCRKGFTVRADIC